VATTTRKSRKSADAAPKQDVYQVITDRIVELLEQGTAPWHQPWDTLGVALSMSTSKHYRGINALLLQMTGLAKGYGSPWWGTYKQISERGGQVRKGEKGTQVVLWKPLAVEDKDNPGEQKQIWMLRTYTVFNAEQVDGDLGLPEVGARPQNDAIAECEAALAVYYATGPKLHFGGDVAGYIPSRDEVRMPERNQFHSSERYYGAWFHESVHSTGHATRLDRAGIVEGHSFGDELYSKEELVAELGAAFLAGHTGIATQTLPSSASYLQSWIKVLQGDKKLVVQAAAQAQKAVDMILGGTAKVETSPDEEGAKPALVAA